MSRPDEDSVAENDEELTGANARIDEREDDPDPLIDEPDRLESSEGDDEEDEEE